MSRLAAPGPLLDHRLLVNAGKGGVGKSTMTAALAVLAASRGKRVLVCEVRSKERISVLLGGPPVGGAIGRIAEGIDGVVLDPKEAMREYGMMQLRSKTLYRAVFENRWMTKFLGFIPSLPELVMLGKALYHVREGGWDLVLLDAPATGHGVTLLGVPQALRDTVPAGPLRSEADWMHALLVDPAITGVNLVAIPEELPVNETLELAQITKEQLQMPLGATFLNRYVPQRFTEEELASLDAGAGHPSLEAAATAAKEQGLRANLSSRYGATLRDAIGIPLVQIPLLYPDDDLDRGAIEEIAAIMGESL